jgi:hypothetical protein
MEAEFFYIVVKGKDGSLVTYSEVPEEFPTADRQATTQDIVTTSQTIVDEVEKSDLVFRISQVVAAMLKGPEEQAVPDKIKERLKERGIQPQE